MLEKETLKLKDAEIGKPYCISGFSDDMPHKEIQKLNERGVVKGYRLLVIYKGGNRNPYIIGVEEARIGIAAKLAEEIIVYDPDKCLEDQLP